MILPIWLSQGIVESNFPSYSSLQEQTLLPALDSALNSCISITTGALNPLLSKFLSQFSHRRSIPIMLLGRSFQVIGIPWPDLNDGLFYNDVVKPPDSGSFSFYSTSTFPPTIFQFHLSWFLILCVIIYFQGSLWSTSILANIRVRLHWRGKFYSNSI